MALNMNPLPYLDLNHFLFTLAIIWVWVTKVHVLYFSAVASESAIQSFSELIYIWAIQKKGSTYIWGGFDDKGQILTIGRKT